MWINVKQRSNNKGAIYNGYKTLNIVLVAQTKIWKTTMHWYLSSWKNEEGNYQRVMLLWRYIRVSKQNEKNIRNHELAYYIDVDSYISQVMVLWRKRKLRCKSRKRHGHMQMERSLWWQAHIWWNTIESNEDEPSHTIVIDNIENMTWI